jgi:hypothetical protein
MRCSLAARRLFTWPAIHSERSPYAGFHLGNAAAAIFGGRARARDRTPNLYANLEPPRWVLHLLVETPAALLALGVLQRREGYSKTCGWRSVEGWVWPSGTRSGHIEPCTLKKQHRKGLRLSGVRPFVLYSLRHTFLTRLGASGCDAWTLARIAGHSSVAISARYVHPSEDAVLAAVERLGGHKIGHSDETIGSLTTGARLLSTTAAAT